MSNFKRQVIMKILHTIKLTVILILFLSSCNKYLDKNPKDAIYNEAFWKTDADAQIALTGCYNKLYSFPMGWVRPYLDCLADNGYSQWGAHNWNITTIVIGQLTPTTGTVAYGGLSPAIYSSIYIGINTFNYFIGKVDEVKITANKKNAYIGEVKFLRALFYFDLVNFYGDVILYKESPATPEDAKIGQSPKEEVLAFIKEDLDFAIANLPNTAFAGHAVKGSALALKTRVLLYVKKWADASTLAKQIMDEGIFSLANNYEGLFLSSGQVNNPEIMFSTVYLGPNLAQNQFHHPFSAMEIEFGWGSHISPYWDLVDAYECTDGRPITKSPLYDAGKPWLNRDPRLKYTIRMPNVTWPAGEPSGARSLTGINMQKYVDLTKAPFNYSKLPTYDNDYVHIRYADVLLMYAEAKNEATGPDESIYQALNMIRGRAGVNMPNVDKTIYNTQELLRSYIRNERRIELALEGQRYFDLKRWHIADIVLPKLKTPGGVPLVFEQKHYLLPFPQSEIDINPNLRQNPGY